MSVEMYRHRMNSYYPQVLNTIVEFQAILNADSHEFDVLDEGKKSVLADTHLTTMGIGRVEQWENILSITPLDDSTLQDRRDTIIARIRGQGKLNTTLINSIVNAFTGGRATSWVEDGVLYVEITPPPNNKAYRFENVEQEIAKKVPAHIGLQVSRNYYEWGEIGDTFATWNDLKNGFTNWEEVYLYVPFTKTV